MIDVSTKSSTLRWASAEGVIKASAETLRRVTEGDIPKGNVQEVARAAGISAAKRTADWMIFCHPIPLDWVEVTVSVEDSEIKVVSEVRAIWKTGVEMEALTAASAALLNIYDMLKPIDDALSIASLRLIGKRGGKSDFIETFTEPLRVAVLVISDSTYAGDRKDKSGKIIQQRLETEPVEVRVYEVLPDDRDRIEKRLIQLADDEGMDLILTTGGTGLGPKDLTPEATRAIIEMEAQGIAEALRSHGAARTPRAMLSRGCVGVRGKCIIVNLPGSSRGAQETLQALFPGILHAFPMLWGGGHEGSERSTRPDRKRTVPQT